LNLQRGQRLKLIDITTLNQLIVTLKARGSAPEYDASCFGVDASDKLADDRYMTFYNQPRTPEGAVQYAAQNGGHAFTLELGRLPTSINKLVMTLIATEPHGLNSVQEGAVTIQEPSGREVARFAFSGQDFTQEKAIMALELYRKDGLWRVHASGQGFSGGLAALVHHFGGEVAAPAPALASAAAPPTLSPTAFPSVTPPIASPAPPPSVSLTKVTLQKQGDSARINLKKDASNKMHVNLNWDKTSKGGFLGFGARSSDLDLGCMFEMQDGGKGVIQALGRRLGARNQLPFIYLDHDDRNGASANGENLYIERPDLIKRVLIFAFIYEGANQGFRDVNGRLRLTDPVGNEVSINLNNPDASRTFCAVAMIENVGGAVAVRKEERYFGDHEDTDQYYRFGFRWQAGSKD
jgi:tellurite resistance protein TerA